MTKTTKKYKIKGLNCSACAKMLELDLEEIGIKAKCSFAKEILEIKQDGNIPEGKIAEIIKKNGCELCS